MVWTKIVKIHLLTTHYCLLAEEFHEEYISFLQPIKEQRHAYEHIIRIKNREKNGKDRKSDKEYIDNNYRKALSHEYRAFFDIADWLTIIYRTQIRKMLSGKDRASILEKYDKYDVFKKFIIETSVGIAKIRCDKDYGNDLIDQVLEYQKILDKLSDYYKTIAEIFS